MDQFPFWKKKKKKKLKTYSSVYKKSRQAPKIPYDIIK